MSVCTKCNSSVELGEPEKKGRWIRRFFFCRNCNTLGSKKISLIPTKINSSIASHPSIPWGKSKKSRTNPRKKRRR